METLVTHFSYTQAQLCRRNHQGKEGYHFVSEIGLSIQGGDANHAGSIHSVPPNA